jgi:glucosylceramidase
VQNEPMAQQHWESCIFTAEEERDFVKNYLGPTLENNQMGDKKIIIWDHNRGIMYQRAKVAFDDPEASKYIWGTGFHWYTGDHFENVKQVAEAFPDKKTIFTEGCVFPFDYEKLNEWQWGERYGKSIIHDLNNSASGWIDWNILLDENGGPNHVANYCYAPVIANTKTGELIYMNSYYYLGHFSKFIRPGAQRIVCSSNHDDLLATAFINKDNSISVVAMNETDRDIEFKIWLEGKGTLVKLPAHGICTLVVN